MGVPPGNRHAYRGIDSEAYLHGTSQAPTPEDARKDGHIIRTRCVPLSPASGFPVSWSQQPIRELSGLHQPEKGITRTIIYYRHLWEASASFWLKHRPKRGLFVSEKNKLIKY